MNEAEINRWLTLSQAARLLGVTPQMVHNYCWAGKLKFINTPLGRLIDPESVKRFAQTRATKKPVPRQARKVARKIKKTRKRTESSERELPSAEMLRALGSIRLAKEEKRHEGGEER